VAFLIRVESRHCWQLGTWIPPHTSRVSPDAQGHRQSAEIHSKAKDVPPYQSRLAWILEPRGCRGESDGGGEEERGNGIGQRGRGETPKAAGCVCSSGASTNPYHFSKSVFYNHPVI